MTEGDARERALRALAFLNRSKRVRWRRARRDVGRQPVRDLTRQAWAHGFWSGVLALIRKGIVEEELAPWLRRWVEKRLEEGPL